MNNESVRTSVNVHEVNWEEDSILIIPESNSWAVLNKAGMKLFERLKTGLSRNDLDYHEKKVLNNLYEKGLVSIGGRVKKQKRILERSRYNRLLLVYSMTDICNLACDYCYAKEKKELSDTRKAEKLRSFASFLERMNKPTEVLFHGFGEPLMHFELIKDIVKKVRNPKVSFSLQTNGTLINDKIAQFLTEHDFSVSVSLDGPREIHDQFRKYANGSGSFEDTLRGLKTLQRQMREVSVVCIVTKESVGKPTQLLDFFIDQEVEYVRFNPCRWLERSRVDLYRPSPAEYFTFYKSVLQKMMDHNKTHPQRIIEVGLVFLIHNILFHDRKCACLRVPCGAGYDVLCIDPKGDVFPCDHFRGLTQFKLGSLEAADPYISFEKNSFQELNKKRLIESPECFRCAWKYICCGDCMADGYLTYGDFKHTPPLCGYYKLMIPHLISLISRDPDLLADLFRWGEQVPESIRL